MASTTSGEARLSAYGLAFDIQDKLALALGAAVNLDGWTLALHQVVAN